MTLSPLSRRHLLAGAALAAMGALAACGETLAPTATVVPATSAPAPVATAAAPTTAAPVATTAATVAATTAPAAAITAPAAATLAPAAAPQATAAPAATTATTAPAMMSSVPLAKELTWWVRSGDIAKVLETLAQEYGKERGVAVTVQVQGDYDAILQKVQAGLAANSLPHLSILGYRNGIPQVADSGKLIATSDFLAKDPGFDIKDIAPDFLKKFIYKGKLQTMPHLLTVPLMHYNATLMKASGLNPDQPPQTWDELVVSAKAMMKRDGANVQSWGINTEDSTAFITWGLIGQNGGDLYDAGGQPIFNSPAGVGAFQFWKELVHTHKVMPPIQHKQVEMDFSAGKLGILLGSASGTAGYEKGAEGKFDYRIARMPAKVQRSVPIGSAALGIFRSDAAHEATAWDFVKWLSRPEANARISIATGYLAMRDSTLQVPELKQLIATNPRRAVALDGVRQDARAVPISPADTVVWNGMIKIAEQLENDANADPKKLLDALAADTVKFLKEY